MSSYNKVILMGNLTRDPQVKNLSSGTVVSEFGVAVNRKWKDPQGNPKEEVMFVDCSAFGKTGELIGQYFSKGKPIFIDGRLKYDSWEDKQSGVKRSKLTVVVENFQFVGGSQDGDGNAGAPQQRQQTSRPAQQRQPVGAGAGRAESPFGDEQQFKEEDIPF